MSWRISLLIYWLANEIASTQPCWYKKTTTLQISTDRFRFGHSVFSLIKHYTHCSSLPSCCKNFHWFMISASTVTIFRPILDLWRQYDVHLEKSKLYKTTCRTENSKLGIWSEKCPYRDFVIGKAWSFVIETRTGGIFCNFIFFSWSFL